MKKKQWQYHRSYTKQINKQQFPRCLTPILNNPNSHRHYYTSHEQSWQTPQNNPHFTHQAQQWTQQSRHCSLKTPLLYNLASGIANM